MLSSSNAQAALGMCRWAAGARAPQPAALARHRALNPIPATTEAKRATAAAGTRNHVKISEDPPQRRGYPAEGSFVAPPPAAPSAYYYPSRLIRRPAGSSVADSGASSPLLPRSSTPTPSVLSAGSQEILRVRCRILPSAGDVRPSRPSTPAVAFSPHLPPPPPSPPQQQQPAVTGEDDDGERDRRANTHATPLWGENATRQPPNARFVLVSRDRVAVFALPGLLFVLWVDGRKERLFTFLETQVSARRWIRGGF